MLTTTRVRPSVLLAFLLLAAGAARPAAAAAIFSNDFETGTTCHWNDTAPTVWCWANPAGGEWYTNGNWRNGTWPADYVNVGIDLDGFSGTVSIAGGFPYVHDFVAHTMITPSIGRSITVTGTGELDGGFSIGSGGGGITASGATANVTVSGPTSFDNGSPRGTTGGHLTLTSVTSIDAINMQLGGGGTVTMPALTSLTGNSFIYISGAGTAFHAPNLASVAGDALHVYVVQIDTGGTLDAPSLTSFTTGDLTVSGAASAVTAPSLANIDNSEISADGGSTLSLASVTSFTFNTARCDLPGCYKLRANGAGSTFSLPNLTTMTSSGGSGVSYGLSGEAINGGHLDLSAVTTITTSNSGNGYFTADGSGSVIDLTALATYDSGAVSFSATNSGQILF